MSNDKRREKREENKQSVHRRYNKKDEWNQSDSRKVDNNSGCTQLSIHMEQKNTEARKLQFARDLQYL